jgi:hypothetical protein
LEDDIFELFGKPYVIVPSPGFLQWEPDSVGQVVGDVAPAPTGFGYGSRDVRECLVELVAERVDWLFVVEELFPFLLVELPLEDGKLSVEVTEEDDSGHYVSLEEVLDQGEDLFRPLSNVGMVDRFEEAGEDVEGHILKRDTRPVEICPQGLDLFRPHVVGRQEATTLPILGRLGDLIARHPQIPGEVGLAEGEHIGLEGGKVFGESFHLLQVVEAASIVVDHADLHAVLWVADVLEFSQTRQAFARLELSPLGYSHEGSSLLPPPHDISGGVVEAVQADTLRSRPRDCRKIVGLPHSRRRL